MKFEIKNQIKSIKDKNGQTLMKMPFEAGSVFEFFRINTEIGFNRIAKLQFHNLKVLSRENAHSVNKFVLGFDSGHDKHALIVMSVNRRNFIPIAIANSHNKEVILFRPYQRNYKINHKPLISQWENIFKQIFDNWDLLSPEKSDEEE